MDAAVFKWLLIDSCGATATLALGRGAGVVGTRSLPGRAFSATWPGDLRGLLTEATWGVKELEAIAVVHGPGSFTGVRVGLAAAKGLCEATGAKLIAVSRLEVIAGLADGEEALAALDAGREEFYVRDGSVERLVGKTEFAGTVRGRQWVTTDTAVVGALGAEEPGQLVEVMASSALRILLRRVRSGRFDDVGSIDANYVRGEQEIYSRQGRA